MEERKEREGREGREARKGREGREERESSVKFPPAAHRNTLTSKRSNSLIDSKVLHQARDGRGVNGGSNAEMATQKVSNDSLFDVKPACKQQL